MNRFVVNCQNDHGVVVLCAVIETDREIFIEDFSKAWEEGQEDLINMASCAESGDHIVHGLSSFMEDKFPSVSCDIFDSAVYSLDSVNI